jgi:hypothetical protein
MRFSNLLHDQQSLRNSMKNVYRVITNYVSNYINLLVKSKRLIKIELMSCKQHLQMFLLLHAWVMVEINFCVAITFLPINFCNRLYNL